MEHPFFPTTTTRAEALRWLNIAEKLLSTRDLLGSKSFATRARDSDPTLFQADHILSIADTLLAADRRIGNTATLPDWYAVLGLSPASGSADPELVATQYRRLALHLNPQKNKLPFADEAFRLVMEAWSVLSNPSKKSFYDREIAFYLQQHQQRGPGQDPTRDRMGMPGLQPGSFIFFGGQPQQVGSSSASGRHFHGMPVHGQDPSIGSAYEELGTSSQQPQSFAFFASGSNIPFGSGSESGSGQGQGQEFPQNYTSFGRNVGPSSGLKQTMPEQNVPGFGGNRGTTMPNANDNVGDGEEGVAELEPDDGDPTFWTSCPYCYHMYEYPKVYKDCTLRCQNCERAFQAVVISSPPPIVNGGYFYCWGFLPLAVSMEKMEKPRNVSLSWTPFSPMFAIPRTGKKKGGQKGPWVYIDDDEVFVELPDSSDSDDDWARDRLKRRKDKGKASSSRGKGSSSRKHHKTNNFTAQPQVNNVDEQEGDVASLQEEMPNNSTGEFRNKRVFSNQRKQPGRVAKNKLDLNVECSNEVEEPAMKMKQESVEGREEDDNIEGIGFFEGLDDFLSNLPILHVVGDDKIVTAA